MARNNHNVGMHFIHHKAKVFEADALAYLERKELKKKQIETKEEFDNVSKEYDKPCILKLSDMKTEVKVNYYDKKQELDFSMYHYKVTNAGNKHKRKLVLWLGYDIGGENFETGEYEPRGYYLYFTNNFGRNINSRKILLLEVSKQSDSKRDYALKLARLYGKEIVSNYYGNYDIEWNKPILEKYGNMGTWMNASRIRAFRSIKNCVLQR